MKKLIAITLCVILMFTFTACGHGYAEPDEVAAMFAAFDNAQDCILLTFHQLVIGDARYDLAEITYDGKRCNIVRLEENGFYAYTYNERDRTVLFLYTDYETFESEILGTAVLPSEIITAFWGDDCFWFRMDDPESEEFNQIYFAWNIVTEQSSIIDSDSIPDSYENAVDGNRSTAYTFQLQSGILNDRLCVTDNQTGVMKEFNGSVLGTFEEGVQIRSMASIPTFRIGHVFERNGDVYFTVFYEAGPLGDPCCYYVIKWNFETEVCEYYTSFYFEEYQDWVVDMYIP